MVRYVGSLVFGYMGIVGVTWVGRMDWIGFGRLGMTDHWTLLLLVLALALLDGFA